MIHDDSPEGEKTLGLFLFEHKPEIAEDELCIERI